MTAEIIAFVVGAVFGAIVAALIIVAALTVGWYERRRKKCKLEEVPFSETSEELQSCPDCEMPILPGMDCPTCYLRKRTKEDGD